MRGRILLVLAVAALTACSVGLAPAQAVVAPTTPPPSVPAAVSGYQAITPARLMDSRPGQPTVDGQFAGAGVLSAGLVRSLSVTGRGGVPLSGAGAVVLNVTVTQPTTGSYLTVFPHGEALPLASNLNFVAAQTIPNLVIAKIGANGMVDLVNAAGTTHVIVDVEGWFPVGSDYTALSPARLVDTRPGQPTVDGQQAGAGAVGPSATTSVAVLGRGGVPASGVGAVVLNVTVTQPTAAGYLTVFPHGVPRPVASNLNFEVGQSIPNLVVAKVGADGKVDVFNAAGATHVIVDVEGWFPTVSSFTPLVPARLMDTRGGQPTVDGLQAGAGPVGPSVTTAVSVLGRGGVPTTGVTAVVLNVTVTQPSAGSYLTVFPHGESRPLASNLNYAQGTTIANLVIAKVGADGKVDLFNATGSTQVIVDVAGWFGSGVVVPADPLAVSVTTGRNHTCALIADRTVRCWGENSVGELGYPIIGKSTTPVTVQGISTATAVDAGSDHNCALLADRTVRCWGNNGKGQLGNGTTTVSGSPVAVQGLTDVAQVSAGGNHSCAVLADHHVRCWGSNQFGQLGNGTTVDSSTPTPVTGITTAVAVTAGSFHTCAVLADHTVRCWGWGIWGNLGDGTSGTTSTLPVSVLGISTATSVTIGFEHSCAVLADSTARCWGENFSGQLANPTFPFRSSPLEVDGLSGITASGAGSFHTCALLANHGVRCWGANGDGQLGNGSNENSTIPVSVLGITSADGISDSSDHTCAVLADGSIRCWGNNAMGQLGDGTVVDSNVPVAVKFIGPLPPVVSTVTSVSAGGGHTCAVVTGGTLRCWGNNVWGQLGTGDSTGARTPTKVQGVTTGVAVSTGNTHTCVLLADRHVSCWGNGSSGQLGNGSAGLGTRSNLPVAVQGVSTATALSATGDHSCALLADGTVRCWGLNDNGQLGNATSTTSSVPVTVQGVSTAVAVSSGSAHSCALLADHSVRCWGLNESGQLGNATTTDSTVPVTVQGISTAVAIESGAAHSCALLADHSVRCWGLNEGGQLGNATTTDSNVPVTVQGISTAASVSAGGGQTCATLLDQSVRCWGWNSNGELGSGTTTNASVPTSVQGVTTAASVSAGGSHTCSVLVDQTVRCWGWNHSGQLGNGTLVDSSVPVRAQPIS